MMRAQTVNEGGMDPRYRKRRLSRRAVLIGITVIAVLGISWFAFSRDGERSPEQTTAEEANQLVQEVGRFMLLPEGETPTVATVTDPEKLKDQPFFENAVPGDKVLIYAQARKIILYNPQQKKIINVATLSADGG